MKETPTRREARNIFDTHLRPINQGRQIPQSTLTFKRFVREQWESAVLPTLEGRIERATTAFRSDATYCQRSEKSGFAISLACGCKFSSPRSAPPAYRAPQSTAYGRHSAKSCRPRLIGIFSNTIRLAAFASETAARKRKGSISTHQKFTGCLLPYSNSCHHDRACGGPDWVADRRDSRAAVEESRPAALWNCSGPRNCFRRALRFTEARNAQQPAGRSDE